MTLTLHSPPESLHTSLFIPSSHFGNLDTRSKLYTAPALPLRIHRVFRARMIIYPVHKTIQVAWSDSLLRREYSIDDRQPQS
jgi:hypothetical protein